MSEKMLVGDLVAEFLQQVGVTTAFGVISVHNIPMLDGIGRRNAIRFVMARGEAGAGHMADAYARVQQKLGVLFTSTGPGAANACGALAEARFASSPVLHLTGQTPIAYMDKGQGTVHDVPDQLGMLKSVSKAAYRVRSPQTALGTLIQAATEALTPPTGPVSVEIPVDIQRAEIERPPMLDNLVLPIPPARTADPAALDQLAAMVVAARRPLLWTGSGARHAGSALQRLLALGIPMVTSWGGRGVVPEDDRMSLGPLNSTPEVEAFYGSVDLLIVAGSRLRGQETRDMTLKLPDRRVQIDVDPLAEGRTYSSELFIAADAAPALAGLADRLEGPFRRRLELDPKLAGDVALVKAQTIENYRAFLGPYGSFPEQLRAAMPRDAIFVRDTTLNNTTWGQRLFPLYDTRSSVYAVGAAIGPGMQFGIGAALGADGRKVVAMCGDGGFFLNVGELWTAVQERAPVCFLVMNDKGYGVIKHIQDTLYGGRHFFGELQGPDLEKLAGLCGMPYAKVSRADAFGSTVEKMLSVDGPTLVEVDMHAIGPFPRYFQAPPYAQKK